MEMWREQLCNEMAILYVCWCHHVSLTSSGAAGSGADAGRSSRRRSCSHWWRIFACPRWWCPSSRDFRPSCSSWAGWVGVCRFTPAVHSRVSVPPRVAHCNWNTNQSALSELNCSSFVCVFLFCKSYFVVIVTHDRQRSSRDITRTGGVVRCAAEVETCLTFLTTC